MYEVFFIIKLQLTSQARKYQEQVTPKKPKLLPGLLALDVKMSTRRFTYTIPTV